MTEDETDEKPVEMKEGDQFEALSGQSQEDLEASWHAFSQVTGGGIVVPFSRRDYKKS